MERLIKHTLSTRLSLRSVVPMEPYYLIVSGRSDAPMLLQEIILACKNCNKEQLLEDKEAPYLGKYDEFVAPELIRRAFLADGLDLKGLAKNLV
ncbi:hypothetical protein D3C74_472340 [compost metagenome]